MAYILRVDGNIERMEGKPTLDELQQAVGGNIEYVPTAMGGYLYCNEEGKLMGLPANYPATQMIDFPDIIVGDVVVMEEGDEEE